MIEAIRKWWHRRQQIKQLNRQWNDLLNGRFLRTNTTEEEDAIRREFNWIQEQITRLKMGQGCQVDE